MTTIAICDNDITVCNKVYSLLLHYEAVRKIRLQFKHFLSVNDLLNSLSEIDILFLEIKIEHSGSFPLSNYIRRIKHNMPIIVLSSYQSLLTQEYALHTAWLLVKPVSESKFIKALDAALLQYYGEAAISFSWYKTSYKLYAKQILYISSRNKGTKIHCKNSFYYSRKPLAHWVSILNRYSFFLCHKSYLVNISSILNIENNLITLINNTKIPVSRRRFKQLQALISEIPLI